MYVLDIPKYSFIILKIKYILFFLGTLMTQGSETMSFFGLQRGVTLSGNLFKISLETYSQNLIFC